MYKLRPLDDNPTEHGSIQYARRRLLFSPPVSLRCSLSPSLKVNSHHNGKPGLSRPIQVLVLYEFLTSIAQG